MKIDGVRVKLTGNPDVQVFLEGNGYQVDGAGALTVVRQIPQVGYDGNGQPHQQIAGVAIRTHAPGTWEWAEPIKVEADGPQLAVADLGQVRKLGKRS